MRRLLIALVLAPPLTLALLVPGSSASAPVVRESPKTAGARVPRGFRAWSASFVTPHQGWVLGTTSCLGDPNGSPILLRTLDDGREWTRVSAPSDGWLDAVVFADPSNGWLYSHVATPNSPDLWVTHDGGTQWTRESIPGLSGVGGIADVEAASGEVSATINGSPTRIATSAVGANGWKLATPTLPEGAGGGPMRQIVLAGRSGWIVDLNRGVLGGAELVNGKWVPWQPPCLDRYGAVLAVADPRHLAAFCTAGRMPTPSDTDVFLSSDGGANFVLAKAPLPDSIATLVASPSPSEFVVVRRNELLASFDAGRTWRVVKVLPSTVEWSQLTFVTSSQGEAVATNGDLFKTADRGVHWFRVPFRSAGL